MRDIQLDAQQEAVKMSIITIMTLVYLPSTFVSVSSWHSTSKMELNLNEAQKTFFSTDVVKYQTGGYFSTTALVRWIELSIPLTMLTVAVAGTVFALFYRRLKKKRDVLPSYNVHHLDHYREPKN